MGKTDARLHARTQADADTMAAKWAATFWEKLAETARDSVASGRALPTTGLYEADVEQLTDAERDAMWRAGTHIQRGRGE